ncbi:MAG: DUF167 domain-containing protein [Proteobacteria bacterium]|nr:DUF167 domain-containing protein [Pseudomonadota bacterium]
MLKQKNKLIILNIKVQPNSKKLGPLGTFGENDKYLKWGVNAAPVDGKANEELLASVAKAFSLSKRDVSIIKGDKSRLKVLAFENAEMNALSLAIKKLCK